MTQIMYRKELYVERTHVVAREKEPCGLRDSIVGLGWKDMRNPKRKTQHDTNGRGESYTEEEEPRSLAREKLFNIHFLLSLFFSVTPNMDRLCVYSFSSSFCA